MTCVRVSRKSYKSRSFGVRMRVRLAAEARVKEKPHSKHSCARGLFLWLVFVSLFKIEFVFTRVCFVDVYAGMHSGVEASVASDHTAGMKFQVKALGFPADVFP